MTIERIIRTPSEINYNGVKTQNLTKDDAIDERTDLSASIKLVDSTGNILLLMETMPLDLETERLHGCFLRRIEYHEKLINMFWDMTLRDFRTCVRLSNVINEVGLLEYCYQYLWVQIPNNMLKQSILTDFDWHKTFEDGEYTTMIDKW